MAIARSRRKAFVTQERAEQEVVRRRYVRADGTANDAEVGVTRSECAPSTTSRCGVSVLCVSDITERGPTTRSAVMSAAKKIVSSRRVRSVHWGRRSSLIAGARFGMRRSRRDFDRDAQHKTALSRAEDAELKRLDFPA